MGLFSRTRTYVSATAGRFIADEDINSSIPGSVYTALTKKTSISQQVTAGLVGGVNLSINNLYRYANTGGYKYGLLDAYSTIFEIDLTSLNNYLNSLFGETVNISLVKMHSPDPADWGKHYLQETYGGDFSTGVVDIPSSTYHPTDKTFTYYSSSKTYNEPLDRYDISVTVGRNIYYYQRLETWISIITSEGIETTTTYTQTRFRRRNDVTLTDILTYSGWVEVSSTTQPGDGSNDGNTYITGSESLVNAVQETEILNTPAEYLSSKYYQVHYTLASDPSTVRIFTEPQSNFTGSLGQSTDTVDRTGFLPIIPLRLDKQSVRSGHPDYLDAQKALDYLGLDLDYVVDKLEENPDIADVRDSFALFGINFYSKSQVGLKYIFEFLDTLPSNITQGIWGSAPSLSDGSGNTFEKPYNTYYCNDGNFTTSIQYSYISKSTVIGSIGSVGTYTSEIVPNGNIYTLGTFQYAVGFGSTYYRYQDTETTYKEIEIAGLNHTTFIGTRAFPNVLIDPNLTDDESIAKRAGFYFPLNYTILKDKFTLAELELLLPECLHQTITSEITVRLKWYETAGFAFIVQAIALIWGGPGLAAAIGTAMQVATTVIILATTGAIMSAIVFAAIAIFELVLLKYFVLKAIEKVLVEVAGIDNEILRIATAILAVVGFAYLGGVGLDLTAMNQAFFATDLITTYLKAEQQIKAGEVQDVTEQIQREISTADAELEELYKYLDSPTDGSIIKDITLSSALDRGNLLTPNNISNSVDFALDVNRGVSIMDLNSSFVERSLQLPT